MIIGGDFTQGGLRLGGAGGLPFVGPDGPRILHHLAIFRVEPNAQEDAETSNLCPVITTSKRPSLWSGRLHGGSGTDPNDQYSKLSCSPGIPRSNIPPGVHMYQSQAKLTGPPDVSSSAFVSAITCLNEKCTDMIVGGSFNDILGTPASSIARLTFDENFYVAKR